MKIIDNRKSFKPEDLKVGYIVVDLDDQSYLIAKDKKNEDFIAINLENLEVSYREDYLDELYGTIEDNGSGGIKEVIEPDQYAIVIGALNKE
jgi:hypothetical protein